MVLRHTWSWLRDHAIAVTDSVGHGGEGLSLLRWGVQSAHSPDLWRSPSRPAGIDGGAALRRVAELPARLFWAQATGPAESAIAHAESAHLRLGI